MPALFTTLRHRCRHRREKKKDQKRVSSELVQFHVLPRTRRAILDASGCVMKTEVKESRQTRTIQREIEALDDH